MSVIARGEKTISVLKEVQDYTNLIYRGTKLSNSLYNYEFTNISEIVSGSYTFVAWLESDPTSNFEARIHDEDMISTTLLEYDRSTLRLIGTWEVDVPIDLALEAGLFLRITSGITIPIKNAMLVTSTIPPTIYRDAPEQLERDIDEYDYLRQIWSTTNAVDGVALAKAFVVTDTTPSSSSVDDVVAGISSLNSTDPNGIAFWSGGTYSQAQDLVERMQSDPTSITDLEWNTLAKWAVTFGGDNFMRGYIYALGGVFKGRVELADGKTILREDGSVSIADGQTYWDVNGNQFAISPPKKIWRSLIDEGKTSGSVIDIERGVYINSVGINFSDFLIWFPKIEGNMAIFPEENQIYIRVQDPSSFTGSSSEYSFLVEGASSSLVVKNVTGGGAQDLVTVSIPIKFSTIFNLGVVETGKFGPYIYIVFTPTDEGWIGEWKYSLT